MSLRWPLLAAASVLPLGDITGTRYTYTLFTLMIAPAAPLVAQAADPEQDTARAAAAIMAAAASIRATNITRHLEVITADSLQPRATPSRGLEATARYIAGQFQQLGLRPRGDEGQSRLVTVTGPDGSSSQVAVVDTSFMQRYRLLGHMAASATHSQINFTVMLRKQGKSILDVNYVWPTEAARKVSLPFESNAFFVADSVPESGGRPLWGAPYIPPKSFVLAGPHTVQTVRAAQLQDKLVLYVPHADADSATRRQIIDRLRASNFVVILSVEDSAAFEVRWRAAKARPVLRVDRYMEGVLGVRYWAVDVRAGAIEALLSVAGLDPAAARVAATPTVRLVPTLEVTVDAERTQINSIDAPNVVGFLPGTDTTVRNEFIMYSAHFDHAGAASRDADNAVGVAGLLELAKAFSQPGARPRRSILFVALSGGATDFSGAAYFAMNAPSPWGAASLTINLKIGLLGRHAPDSVTVDGMHDLELATRPDWVAMRHPELKLAVADGGTILLADADHLALIRGAVPSLYFSSGRDSAAAGTTSDVDADHAARALQLAFYFGQDLANAVPTPRWNPAGRRERARFLGD